MKQRGFIFLLLSIFIVVFGSIGCNDSFSGKSVANKQDPTPPTGPGFYLISPFVSPGNEIPSGFIIKNLPNSQVTVSLYFGLLPESSCGDSDHILLIKPPVVVEASRNEITFEDLEINVSPRDGTYKFFARIEGEGLSTTCIGLPYILDTTPPVIVDNLRDLLENDDTPTMSKTWNWSCRDRDGTTCEYRYKIEEENPINEDETNCETHTFPLDASYSDASTATKIGGDGKFCIHIQAKDEVGNKSPVTSVYATLDNTKPAIVKDSVRVQDKTYAGGDPMDITVNFNEPVIVTKLPQIELTFDDGVQSQTKYAVYHSGSGSTEVVFRYTVVRTDSDPDGISMEDLIDLNSGSLQDRAGNPLNSLQFDLPGNISDVLVDGEKANIVISKTNLSVGEDEGTDTYEVNLNRAPSDTVRVTFTSGSVATATVTPSSVIFEPDDSNGKWWSVPQTITVTGVNDNIDNNVGGGPQRTVDINYGATSSDTDYNGNDLSGSLKVTSMDDDDIGSVRLTLNPVSVDEHDSNSTSSVANNTETVTVTAEFQGSQSRGLPSTDVRLSEDLVLVTSVGVGTAQAADFNPVSNFNINILANDPRGTGTFTLTVVDDRMDDDNETLRVSASNSSGLTVAPATLTVNDNDSKGVEVSLSSLSAREGTDGSYTLHLQSVPTGPVTVRVTSGNTGVATVSPSSVTFEPDDSNGKWWSVPQSVTVSGVDDNVISTTDRSTRITHTISGGGYSGVNIPDVSVTITDKGNRLVITDAEDILSDNYESYSVSGSCVSGGGDVSVQVGSLDSESASCTNSRWSADIDTSEIPNGDVSVVARQTVDSNTTIESENVNKCVASGEGTSSDPRWICNYDDLKTTVNSYNNSILGRDIDARASWSEGDDNCGAYNGTDIATTNPCAGWGVITASRTVDGRDHTIDNLYIHSSAQNVGLFGSLSTVVVLSIFDFHLRNVRIHSTGNDSYVGAIAGHYYGNIENCSVTGMISSSGTGNRVGGLVGSLQGELLNSYANVEISAQGSTTDVNETSAGGLAGTIKGGSFIMSSHSRGSVSINGNTGNAGGLVGRTIAANLYWSYSHANVSGEADSGGLVGDNFSKEHTTISHSYALGTGSNDPLLGGVLIQNGSHLFWDKDTSGASSSQAPGSTGLTTVNMKVACTSSETTGICALADGFSLTAGHYPKVKKCTTCDEESPVFSSDELVGGQ